MSRRRLTPYILLAPGLVYLAIFFAWPMVNMIVLSLESPIGEDGYAFTWHFATYADAVSTYWPELLRSLWYGAAATAIALVISYPLAYMIAFRGGRFKNVLLVVVVLPFFTSYLIRTVAWQNVLADDGPVTSALQGLGLLHEDGRLLATTGAVIAGITYNFLPFMILPLYASLERIDKRLIEAGQDLYAGKVKTFVNLTLPLSLPGILAGSLLTFIPACGDFINAQLLGTSRQYMIGNVILSKFLVVTDYPTAAALGFVLMATTLFLIAIYARFLRVRSAGVAPT